MTDTLLTSRAAREAQMDNIYVLNKVKALAVIPNTDFVNQKMVADYYEVDSWTIKYLSKKHQDELISDGMRHVSLRDFGSEINLTSKISKRPGGRIIEYDDGTIIDLPNAGMKVYPRRAILRIGMLLQDSPVAKAVRDALLNAADSHQTMAEQTTGEEEQPKMNGQLDKILEVMSDLAASVKAKDAQIDKLLDLLTSSTTPHQQPFSSSKVVPFVKRDTVEEVSHTEESPSDWNKWSGEILGLVKEISAKTKRDNRSVLHNAYQRIDSQYWLSTQQYLNDYRREVDPNNASMLKAWFWMETEKDPSLRGVLLQVLNDIKDEVYKTA